MEKLRILIADDERLARRGLKLRLEKYEDIELIGECRDGNEALEMISDLNPDLIFLDIQMPNSDGFDVVKNLQDDAMPLVVFVTAFDQYAVKAFEVHAVDYILKPADDEHLDRALSRARRKIQEKNAASAKERLLKVISDITGRPAAEMEKILDQGGDIIKQYPDKISIKDGDKITRIDMQEIDWIDAAGDYMCIHADNQIHIMRTTMKQLENRLDPSIFQRIHRSTIVNLNRVKELKSHINGEYNLILLNGARLKMSRSYKDKIKCFTNK